MSKLPLIRTLLLVITLSGCASTHDKWGEHATVTPSWEHLKGAAITAATDSHTWAPLLGAAVFDLGGFDQRTSDWAVRHNPLFGSIKNAQDASDTFEDISRANYFITAMVAPSGQGTTWFQNKAPGLMIGFAARRVNGEVTDAIKFATDRKRPDKSDLKSFPSGHTSNSTIYATLAAQNVEYLDITPYQKTLWQTSSYTVAGLTAWARVEGQRHYPSDVLAGYALGHFLGAFINDAFINPNNPSLQLEIEINSLDKNTLSLTHHW